MSLELTNGEQRELEVNIQTDNRIPNGVGNARHKLKESGAESERQTIWNCWGPVRPY